MIKSNKIFLGMWWSGRFLKIVKGILSESIIQFEVLGVHTLEGLNDKDIVEQVKSASKRCKNRTKTVLFVSRRNVIERFIEIPSMKKREIHDMISLQLEHHFPYTVDEMYYDFIPFDSEKDGYSHIVLTAISKNECDRILNIVSLGGIKLDLLSVSSWGIVSAYISSSLYTHDDKGHVLLIDSDYNETEFIIMQGKRVTYTRSITHDPNFTHSSQQASFIEHILNELNHTLDTLKRDTHFKTLSKVILGSTLSFASHNFKESFSSNVPIVNFNEYYKPVILGEHDSLRSNNLSLVPFYGMPYLSDFPIIDLLPSSLKEERTLRESSPERILAGFLFVFLCLVIGISIFFHFYNRYQYLKEIEQKLTVIDPEAKKVSRIIKKIRVIDAVKQGQIVPLEMVSELYRIIPQQVYVTLLEYDATRGINMRGFAANITQVSDLLLILQKSSYFKSAEIKFAKQKIIKGQEGVDFEISCPYFTIRE